MTSKTIKIFCALLLLLIGGGIAIKVFNHKPLPTKDNAATYFNETIQTIFKSWDAESILKNAAPELLQDVSKTQIQDTLTLHSKLGKLEKIETPKVVITEGTYPNTSYKGVFATCDTIAKFEAGSGKIRMVLKHSGNSWLIIGFHMQTYLPSMGQISLRNLQSGIT
jgi:hypothetical protein